MRRTFVLLVALLAFVGVPSAGAITGSSQQDFVHSYVGLVAFYDAAGNRLFRCSGSMISPRTMLTAGHCADPSSGAVSARVWLDQAAAGYPDAGGAPAHGIANFGFTGFIGQAETHDIGVVILDDPVSLSTYGALAGAGSLEAAAARLGKPNVTFTASGYGVASLEPLVDPRQRLMADERLANLNSKLTDGYNVETTAGQGNGVTCAGDSGGPLLFAGTDTITAVDSFGMKSNCKGNDYMYRVDRGPVLDWILAHVPAGERNAVRVVGP